MVHAVVLALYIVLGIRDLFAGDPGDDPFPLLRGGAWESVGWSLTLLALLAGFVHVLVWREARLVDRTGRPEHVERAHRIVGLSRIALVLLHAANVLALGWLDGLRALTGDLIVVDELLALAAPLLVICAGWWSLYPIDRRVREAVLLGMLDAGEPPPDLPSRGQFVADHLRHHVLLIFVPIMLISAWWEAIDLGAIRLAERWDGFAAAPWAEWALGGAHFAGVLVILALMPMLLRRMWRTEPLGPGALRDRLERLCRAHRVRVRELLVWRTHQGMINGALVGVVPPFRYILLTDALLDRLPTAQVEAVMAHEVAHARRRHLPWMLAAMIGVLGLAWAGAAWALGVAIGPAAATSPTGAVVIGGVTLSVALLIFGHVSRVFEQQADAFAAQHLSRHPGPGLEASTVIRPEAAEAMAGALGAVARLNRLEPDKFSFRHGSIGGRQRRLLGLIGLPVGDLPIDRRVAGLKIASIGALLLLAALSVWRPELFLVSG